MDEAILTNRLKDLVRYIASVDMAWTDKPGCSGGDCPAAALRSRINAEELLDFLRFNVKYLVFDLEATRRENAILRSIITSDGE
ncbi:MAG: hypothetical protein JXN61_05475 [Sedimentisphaerales bacterium]|nr:hypothetical protein [Sedimentisphaerales bacterium]